MVSFLSSGFHPATTGLWALRIFGLIVGAMVIYTFLSQLG